MKNSTLRDPYLSIWFCQRKTDHPYTHVREVAKTAGIAVKNLYDRTHRYLTSLYSRPWMLKHATDAVLNGIIVEGVLQPTLFYAGALSIIGFIEEQNAVEKMIREKLR